MSHAQATRRGLSGAVLAHLAGFKFRLEWLGTKLKATVDGETLEAEHERFGAKKKQFWFAIANKTASVRNFRVLGF